MAKNCVWNPGRKKSGDEKGSKLYQSLLSFTNNNRKDSLKMYFYIIGEDFKRVYRDIIKYNDEGEPELSSIIGKVDIKGIIDDASNTARITESLGEATEGKREYYEDTAQNYITLSNKAVNFNDRGEYPEYVAVVRKGDNGLYLSIERAVDENKALASKIKYNSALNRKLREILSELGIDLESVYSLEDELQTSGVVDYENADTLANGLIRLIRLADSAEGEEALPEEFSHFMIDVMRNNPIIERLFNTLRKNDLYKEILGEEYSAYYEEYSGDEERLLREAAGKLVSNSLQNPSQEVQKYKNFIQRAIDAIKEFIRKTFNIQDINNAIKEAKSLAYDVSNIIVSEDAKRVQVKLEDLKQFSNLDRLATKAKTAEQIVSGSIDRALKKYSFYIDSLQRKVARAKTDAERNEAQDELAKYQLKAEEYIYNQRADLQQGLYNQGVVRFIEEATKDLKGCVERLKKIAKKEYGNAEVGYQLRNIKNIIDSHQDLVEILTSSADREESGVQLTEENQEMLNTLNGYLNNAKQKYEEESLEAFSEFLQAVMPDNGIEYNEGGLRRVDGKFVDTTRRKKITKEDISKLLSTAQKDISIIDMWVNSAAETKDIILKLSDKAIKQKKDEGRQEVLKLQKTLLAAAKKLKDETGSSSTDFMFEQHEDGSLSNRYKSEINWTAWHDSRAAVAAKIKELGLTGKDAREEWRRWRKENCTETGMPSSEYRNPNFLNELTDAQKEYYNTFMKIRKQLVGYLPMDTYDKTDPMKAVQITKDMWEKMKTLPLGELPSSVWSTVKEQTIGKPDDTEYGNIVKTTFSGELQLGLPIFYIRDVENEKLLSRDTASTLIAFADMAINYQKMSEIVDIFEVGKDVAGEREAYYTKADKIAKEVLKAFGNKAQRDAKQQASNFVQRFNHLVESQIYGKYMQGGTVGETDIKTNKVSNLLVRWTSLTSLAFNGLAGIAAAINDMINIDNEALSKRQFTGKQLLQADKIYTSELPGLLGEAGNPIKTNKLSLFIEMFDVLHEYENDVRNIEWGKSKAKRLASSNALYLFMHMGSHFGETRTALAQAINTQITSKDGTQTKNLWDVLHVKYIDENDHSLGATLEVEEGFELPQSEITRYSRKFMALNERLFGAYNKADRNMLQSTAIGQLVMLFRKFMVPAINRRFRSGDYNLEIEEETEGFYVTFGKFLFNLAADTKNYGRSIKLYKQDLNEYELANLHRAERELGTYVALIVAVALMGNADWDKKDNPWGKRITNYLASRAKMEIGAFTPFGIFGETFNLLKSPMASINTLEKAGDLVDLVNPWAWNQELKSGRYKGHSKAYKSLMQNIPMNHTIYKMFHPEESLIAFR